MTEPNLLSGMKQCPNSSREDQAHCWHSLGRDEPKQERMVCCHCGMVWYAYHGLYEPMSDIMAVNE